ncbi:autotransporter-associated N-terminal domain-containing protein [Fusobacterium varium]|uniref:autotransporter-associated N-terminal domain-containing protein n=1 Tax=Fusobacterium TaxID=848 RepID=UPI0030D51DCF
MKKNEIEKSLKRFLKRKVSYSVSLLVAFMITGGIAAGAGITAEEIHETKEELLTKIQREREEIKQKLLENDSKLKALNLDSRILLKEADFYSKPVEPAYGFTMIGGFKKADSVGKDWKGSVRGDTPMDKMRKRFNEVHGNSTENGEKGTLLEAAQYTHNNRAGGYASSGWINMNGNYHLNTNVYDAEAKLFILPVVKAPVVIEPTIPNVSFTVPTAPTVIPVTSPAIASITVGAVNVTAPTVVTPTVTLPTTPAAPGDITVTVNEPNINVNIGAINVAGPGALNIPTLSTPSLSISVPLNLPPRVEDPNPVVTVPTAPPVPTFTAFTRGRGDWMGGFTFIQGRMDWNRSIYAWEQGSPRPSLRGVNSQPMFNVGGIISGKGKASTSKITAYTASNGVVTNSYTDIKASVTVSGGNPNNQYGAIPYPTFETSIGAIPGMTANTYYSAVDTGALPTNLPSGITNNGTTSNPNSIRYQQSWIFQGAPTVQDMAIKIGGSPTYSTAVFAQTGGIVMNRVALELAGRTIIGQLSTANVYNVKFTDVDINITGNENSILTTQVFPNTHVYWASTNASLSTVWGRSLTDNIASTTAVDFGGTKLASSTSKNTIFYIAASSMHRWNGYSNMVPLPGQSTPAYDENSESYFIYAPVFGNMKVQNTGGNVTYTGSGNVGVWVAGYVPDRTKWVVGSSLAPSLDLGTIYLQGDKNVGYYLAGSDARPDANGVFQGNVAVDTKIGTDLDGSSGNSQVGTGNIAGNDNSKSEDNVAIYIASGQRSEMNNLINGYKQYFPATLGFQVNTVSTPSLVGIANGSEIGYPYLNADPIKNLTVSNFKIELGKYSKRGIGMIAKNGSVVDVNIGTTISDNAGTGIDRATESILFYAEGVWQNPRKALTGGIYDKEAYGRGESITGKKYISNFNSTINVNNNIVMNSYNSIALFAKSGAKITGKDITMNGYGSKGVFAHGVYNYAAGTIVDSNGASANVQPDTTITVDSITAKANGIVSADKNNNIGAAAISGEGASKGLGNTNVMVTGKVDVTGLGAFARGDKATVTISGAGSNIVSGDNGALVAKEGGKINFGGGTIEHEVENKLAFFSEKIGAQVSNINFTNNTTLNISKGVVFYGDSNDYSTVGKIGAETGRYTGMGKLTVNLTGHGVNLGVFRNIDVTWDGSATYVNGLKTIPKVAAINTGTYWYKSSLDGGKISIQTNVNRDNISSGGTSGDGFNDIIMERKEVTLESGYTITSANGNSMLLGSNSTAALNTESGYTIKGTIDISNTLGSPTTAAYTSFGYIDVDTSGELKVSEGIGAYGVNGSKMINNGIIEVTNSNNINSGIGMAILATNASGTQDAYGKNTGKAGLWGEVINKGIIDITGTHGIGIYMENNHNSALKTQMAIYNEAPITLGDNGKGIVIRSTNTTGAGGTLTLKDSGSGRDIKVGKNGIGIYAQGSDVKMDGNYGIEIQEGGVALQSEGNSIISRTNAADKLTVDYAGTSGTGNTAIGIAFKGVTGNTFNNNMNMDVLNTNGAETIVGIYGSGAGTLTNSGNITAESTGSYGIISEGVDVVNTGLITVGDSGLPVSSAIGIYVKDASVDAVGKDIVIQGNGDSSTSTHPIGIYAKSSIAGNREIKVTNGASPMSVAGKAGIGIYVEDTVGTALKLNNSSNIVLGDSSAVADRRFGIFMTNAKNTANETSGIITVGENNIGIYSKDSILKNSGTINVTHNASGTENIGIHNVTDNENFTFSNSGTINVNGVSNIGISAKTTGTHQGSIELSGGTLNVTAASLADGDIPLGIYASGNNITISSTASSNITADPNAVGIYIDGDNTSKTSGLINLSLSSDTGGKMGIGAYYKGGAFADAGTMKLSSTTTALSGSDPVRPIGLYYGTGSTQNKTDIEIVAGSDEIIGMYGSTLAPFTNSGNITLNAKGIGAYFIDTDVTNSGNVTVNANDGYGMYFKGGDSSSTGTITATGSNSAGVIVTQAGAEFTNSIGGIINSGGISSIGVYAENGTTFTNAGTLNSTLAGGSIGAFAKGSTIENTGTIGSHNLGLYGKDASTINYTSGTMTINSGVGILVDGLASTVNLNGGTITGTVNNTTSVVGKNTGIVNLNGTNISQSGSGTVGIVIENGSSTLTSGNISVGAGGTGVYAKNSAITLSGYSGNITMGNQGIAMYSEDSALSSGTLNVNYTNTAKGVGIYYEGTNPVTNNITINHTGDNLVSIFADGISLTNTAAQTINADGIGIYGDNGAAVSNQGTLTLSGDDTIGIYLDGASSTVTDMGTITGTPSTVGNKIGVYVNSGDIIGNTAYNFDIDGGIGIYLKNNDISYTGTMTVTGDSTIANRTIGIYVDPGITGTLGAKINVTGEDALGIYLAENMGVAANITYNGELNITSSSTANKGIGALLEQGSTFTLGAGGKVDIGGTNNMGFYVKNGANLNVSGGTVTNTAAGIFAYLDNGNLHFTSGTPVNINFANVIVSGVAGNILNDTAITVGTSGLQGDSGATITNSNLGTINGNVVNAKAMVGTGVGTTLVNAGTINLTGDTSIGMYTEDFAVGTSTGHVSVGDKSAAYYVGTDGTMNISGTASVGEDSTLLFGAGGTINYTGADIVMSNKSIALTLSDSAASVDFNTREVTTGTEGTGIFLTGTGDISKVTNLAKLNVHNKATGIFMDNNVALNTGMAINIIGTEAIGVFTTNNGNINYSGNMSSSTIKNKGIINTGTGTTVNSGTIQLTGDSSIGMYGENGTMINNSSIEVGNGAYTGLILNSAVAMYGKNVTSVSNSGNIKIGKDAVGIFGENTVVTNSNSIQSTGAKSTGIYGLQGSASNTGSIVLGNSSNGIFVKNGTTITNTGNITVGNTNSAGIYGAGTTSVDHNSGTITAGKESVGIATENGNITVANGAVINVGTDSSYIYSASGTGTNNTNLSLSDHSIGMYTKSGTMINNANIIVGKSTVVSGLPPKISVGMAAESGTVENSSLGYIHVPDNHGVGMVANDLGHGINRGTIRVDGNLAYGMQATKGSTLENHGAIIVDGANSRGMAATDYSIVRNHTTGTITVNGADSEGIYVDYGATAENYGTINVNGAGRTGIYLGTDGVLLNKGTINLSGEADGVITGSGSLTNVGDITINGPTASIDGITITNTGTITVNGALDFGTITLGSTAGHIGTINADSFNKGQFIVLPNVTQGSNHDMYTVQYLNGITNVPNHGSITAISHSVSFIADVQKDDTDPNLIRVVLVRIPYKKLLAGTDAIEFGKGLDEIFAGAADKELEMFDALKNISDKDELGATFDNELRGNVYANIQTRMLDINEVFTTSYENLRNNRLYSRETLKIGAIMTGGETKSRRAGVEDYESKSLGTMILKEYDHMKYGRVSNWSVGFTQTKFDFDPGSKETVYSLNAGVGFEDYIKDSKNLKYYTRGEISVNHHETDRKIHLSSGTYENTGKFWSGTVEWKNKLRYDIPLDSEKINIGLFGTFNLGYGKFEDFKESGDGIELDIESKDMYIVRPGVGADIAFNKYAQSGKYSLIGKATAEYELGKVYDGANKAKIKNTDAGYYDLEKPKKVKDIIKIGAELKYETREGHSIGFEVTRQEGSVDATRYGVNLMYRF